MFIRTTLSFIPYLLISVVPLEKFGGVQTYLIISNIYIFLIFQYKKIEKETSKRFFFYLFSHVFIYCIDIIRNILFLPESSDFNIAIIGLYIIVFIVFNFGYLFYYINNLSIKIR